MSAFQKKASSAALRPVKVLPDAMKEFTKPDPPKKNVIPQRCIKSQRVHSNLVLVPWGVGGGSWDCGAAAPIEG